MSFQYKNMQVFVAKVVEPHIVALRRKIEEETAYFQGSVDALRQYVDTCVTALHARIDNLITDVNNRFAQVLASLDTHANRRDNPHVVRPHQIAYISATAPAPSQGQDGDLWIEYLP